MPWPGDFLVVHLVEKQQVGNCFERSRLQMPLHITLASWLRVADASAFRARLKAVATQSKPFVVRVGGVRLFGPNNDVPVNIMEPSEGLEWLREAIVAAARSLGVEFESAAWMNKGFVPHITHHGEHQRHAGDIEEFNDFHLIQLKVGNMCEVTARFALGGGQ